jgi:hypothetical protein
MKEYICNYAILRFLPYQETGEFVNIGVLLCCPELGFLDFELEEIRRKRVTDFFPELDRELYKSGLKTVLEELRRIRHADDKAFQQNLFASDFANQLLLTYKEVTKIRENVFRFSQTSVLLAENPQTALENVFQNAVQRQFADSKDYQEKIMAERLTGCLKQWKLSHYYKREHVGNDEYRVAFPFVHSIHGVPKTALKPLDLNKKDTSRIFDHGDEWIARIARLKRTGTEPIKLVFPVWLPRDDDKRKGAANEICDELEKLEVITVPFARDQKHKKDLEYLHELANVGP